MMKEICIRCTTRFEYQPRADEEVKALKANLLIADASFVPLFCDSCVAMTGVGVITNPAFVLRIEGGAPA